MCVYIYIYIYISFVIIMSIATNAGGAAGLSPSERWRAPAGGRGEQKYSAVIQLDVICFLFKSI